MSTVLEKRRNVVHELCILKNEKILDVANQLNVSERTVRNDITHLEEKMAKELIDKGHSGYLQNKMRELDTQKERITSYIKDPSIPDTARARYEGLLIEINKTSVKLAGDIFEKYASIDTSKTLEDALKSSSFTKFNEIIGLPLHPFSKMPQYITQAQLQVFEAVNPAKRSWVVLNKSRQCGFT